MPWLLIVGCSSAVPDWGPERSAVRCSRLVLGLVSTVISAWLRLSRSACRHAWTVSLPSSDCWAPSNDVRSLLWCPGNMFGISTFDSWFWYPLHNWIRSTVGRRKHQIVISRGHQVTYFWNICWRAHASTHSFYKEGPRCPRWGRGWSKSWPTQQGAFYLFQNGVQMHQSELALRLAPSLLLIPIVTLV